MCKAHDIKRYGVDKELFLVYEDSLYEYFGYSSG